MRPQVRIAGSLVILAALVLIGLTLGGRSAKDADPHLAAIREQMERIHSGKVDDAMMKAIEADVVQLHQGVAEDKGDQRQFLQVVAYLELPDRPSRHPHLTSPIKGEGYEKGSMDEALPLDGGGLGGGDVDAGVTSPEKARGAPKLAMPVADRSNADSGTADNRTYVGQKTCESCHQQEGTNWTHTIHAKIFNLHPRDGLEAQNCEACHGPGSEHIKNPADLTTIISFSGNSKTPVPQQNAQCLTCHKGGQRIFWHDSVHETNNVACSDCHNPMTNFGSHGLTARESVNQTCFQCHKEQRAEFAKRSHMPLLEGKIACVDCHNPHGSTTAPLLKADSVNELCYSCHAEKRGPFLFEHAPVRESCLNCHAPHGSNFENLLTTPRPVLCQQCHSQSGHPSQLLTAGNLPRGPMPDPRLIATSCSTCHVNIHGSNDPSGPRFER